MTAPTTAFGVVEYEAPLVNPSPQGLYAATSWTEAGTGPLRFLGEGVRIRPHNYGGLAATGVWGAPWCGTPGSGSLGSGESLFKDGVRPDIPDPFAPVTVWAYDECDPTAASQAEVRTRVAQNLRLMEQTLVERQFADRLLADAAVVGISGEADLRDALGYLEGALAVTNTIGVIHASAELATQEFGLVIPRGTSLTTPMGHQWVFGGGYVDGLGGTLVATSPLFGWRGDVSVIPTLDEQHNVYAAVAERSVVVGYEWLVAAATLT